MWCRIIKFPSVILRPGTRIVEGGGVDVVKGGVGLAVPYSYYLTFPLLISQPIFTAYFT